MKYPAWLSLALVLALGTFIACNKDDDKPKVIYEKTGLALSASQEVPPNTSTATGTMDVSYNKDTKVLNLQASWSNLTDNPVAAHIHGTALRGVNAGVKFDLGTNVTSATGTFTANINVDNIAIKEDSLLLGFYYFNVHTPINPGGEIRGQIEF